MTSQGAAAVYQGQALRADVAGMLANHGYERIETADLLSAKGETLAEKFASAMRSRMWPTGSAFSSGVPVGTDVFERPFDAHVLMMASGWTEPLALFCFHQQVSGSAKDKIVASVRSMQTGVEGIRCAILMEGAGLDAGVRNYVRREAGATPDRICWVCDSVSEFRVFLTCGSRFPQPSLLY